MCTRDTMPTRKIFNGNNIGVKSTQLTTIAKNPSSAVVPVKKSPAQSYSLMCDIDQAVADGELYGEQNKWSVETFRISHNYVLQIIHVRGANPNVGSVIIKTYFGRPGAPITLVTESRMDGYEVVLKNITNEKKGILKNPAKPVQVRQVRQYKWNWRNTPYIVHTSTWIMGDNFDIVCSMGDRKKYKEY